MARRGGATSGQIRIIGGNWRGRKLRFRAAPGLRPTPDRVRETLFNWLGEHVIEAHCLDLFAGSGALGLEALSRGAARCSFVDSHEGSIAAIREHLATLACDRAECHRRDAIELLQGGGADTGFDLVFLDPPFQAGLLEPAASALEGNAWLADKALVYIESGTREPEPTLPANWTLHRDKSAGEVRYRLFVRHAQFD